MREMNESGPMSCDEATRALLLGVDDLSVARGQRHFATCSKCRLGEDEEFPASIRSALPMPSRLLTISLIVIGLGQAFLALPWLVGSDPLGLLGATAPPTHTTRDGAVGLVIAVAGLLTAFRPQWARPAFWMSSAAIVAQVVSGLIDSSITATGSPEFIHLVGVGLTVLIGASVASQLIEPLGPNRSSHLRAVKDEARDLPSPRTPRIESD